MRFLTLAISFIMANTAAFADVKNPLSNEGSWLDLKPDIVGDADLQTEGVPFTFDAPYRAHDAAIVPIVIEQTDPKVKISAIDIVVDENPAPLVAHIVFGPAMHPLKFETRVRVNQYSNVRAIAETADGHFMTGRFVKASGGCSAPATKDPALALADMGKTRIRFFDEIPPASGIKREAQIMVRHPNYSGLQRDQITQLFISAHFIDQLEVFQGDEMLFTLTGGISISENPVFRFAYTDNGSGNLRMKARDTEGNVFEEGIKVVYEQGHMLKAN